MGRHKNPENYAINKVMDIEEASEFWGMSKARIKTLCADGAIIARKVGRVWIIEKNQRNPRKYATSRTAAFYASE